MRGGACALLTASAQRAGQKERKTKEASLRQVKSALAMIVTIAG